MRTAWAESQDNFIYDQDSKQQLLNKTTQGPLLAEINNAEIKILFPAPADSLCLNDEESGKKLYRLKPEEIDNEKEGSDLPKGLMPVFLQNGNKQKPAKAAPVFWYLDRFIDWLTDDNIEPIPVEAQGINSLPIELRTHVAIDPVTRTNKVSHLFQTAGIDFSEQQQVENDTDTKRRGWQQGHYGLLMRFSDDIPDSYRTIGGEARLGHLKKTGQWPEYPKKLEEKLKGCTTFRLHLITPAIFSNGYLPDFIHEDNLDGTLGDLKVTLRAVAVPRWQAGTSWDMLKGKQGKGMRKVERLVPAGTVYWFEITQGDASELANYWLSSISGQRKNDGYGLVVPGIWIK
jgi:CRISPR-associated protein Cmr3